MLASEVRKGSAEVLILGALEARARHGYEIARLVATRSDGAIELNTATLYPTLHRLERKGLVVGRWVEREGERRRRFYRLTSAGRTALREQRRSWHAFLTALTRAAGIGEA
jgi:transcriptional regulator